MMFTFNKKYFLLFLLVFVTEVLIALYVHDDFIRPYFGDVLVVILIYCFIKSFVKIKVWMAAFAVLAFAFGVEFCQYLNLVEKLNLQHSRLACTVIGTSFSWIDILTYVIGIAIVIAVEKLTNADFK
jgi:DNA integrity scanning protein DisA with diadenylate cyclase activity